MKTKTFHNYIIDKNSKIKKLHYFENSEFKIFRYGFGDQFIPHLSPTTNIINYLCPCGKATCIVPTPTVCSLITTEDMMGKGHWRLLYATTKQVLAFKIPIGRIMDPLGYGKPGKSWPCSSVVAFGSPNVLAS